MMIGYIDVPNGDKVYRRSHGDTMLFCRCIDFSFDFEQDLLAIDFEQDLIDFEQHFIDFE